MSPPEAVRSLAALATHLSRRASARLAWPGHAYCLETISGLLACTLVASIAGAQTGQISGRVTDAAGTPLQNISVAAYQRATGGGYVAVTSHVARSQRARADEAQTRQRGKQSVAPSFRQCTLATGECLRTKVLHSTTGRRG